MEKRSKIMEVGAGIEPAFTDLQSGDDVGKTTPCPRKRGRTNEEPPANLGNAVCPSGHRELSHPARIHATVDGWVAYHGESACTPVGSWGSGPFPGTVEYIRADAVPTVAELQAALDAKDREIERLRNPPEEYCARCGHPKSNHPYRHPFVGTAKGTDQ